MALSRCKSTHLGAPRLRSGRSLSNLHVYSPWLRAKLRHGRLNSHRTISRSGLPLLSEGLLSKLRYFRVPRAPGPSGTAQDSSTPSATPGKRQRFPGHVLRINTNLNKNITSRLGSHSTPSTKQVQSGASGSSHSATTVAGVRSAHAIKPSAQISRAIRRWCVHRRHSSRSLSHELFRCKENRMA